MPLPARMIRLQLNFMKPLMVGASLDMTRKFQDRIGELMEFIHRRHVIIKDHAFSRFEAAWVMPRDERRHGVILYLHGGGYTCGDLEYAKGCASTLAAECGTRVFCAAYRLAPEHPFPSALDDSLEAYQYLLDKGYAPKQITLCGESAGGGLIYAMCLKLRQMGLPMPGGLIGISPWTDLTSSGASYEENRERDPFMTIQLLDFYAGCYAEDRRDPLVSPLFADLTGMPPSLLFVGGDEIMLDDARVLHQRLLEAGCQSSLVIRPERWHGYLLFNLQEDEADWYTMNRFLNRVMAEAYKLRWMRLDNAAKIYPAARRRNWSNIFRMSATLTENVDVGILQDALDVTVRRFPSIAVRLRRGVFWYYLQQMPKAPEIRRESSHPLVRMNRKETRRCAFRVIVYKRRIAVEFFHALTDGTGAMIFLKSLVAEYLQQKYGVSIPAKHGVLGRLEEPVQAETEDSFQKYAADVAAPRKETAAWRLRGTLEPDGFLHQTCFRLHVPAVLEKAHAYHVTVTEFLCAVMLQALLHYQQAVQPVISRRKPVKVLIPVNLRSLFPSKTLRNFALYTTPEVDPLLGEYSFDELCAVVHHRMGLDVNAKRMSTRIATNVNSERSLFIRILPLFIKNAAMKAVFDAVGERSACLCLSNLGRITVPEEMEPFLERFDFVIGPQASAPYNCGVLSYGDTLYINFIRNIRESSLEYHFFQVLRDMGLEVTVESNQR